MKRQALLLRFYATLSQHLGPSHWWVDYSPLAIAISAILTQNTSWSNVEKVMADLKAQDLLHGQALNALSDDELGSLIRPAGLFRVKTQRIRNFLFFLKESCAFQLENLRSRDMSALRSELLMVSGIGPETADTILLYALSQPIFVVDAYTHRIFHRHALVPQDMSYEDLQSFFMDALPPDIDVYKEFHALLVRVAQTWCLKKNAHCAPCPLGLFMDE